MLTLDDVRIALKQAGDSVDALLKALSVQAQKEVDKAKEGKQLPTSSLSAGASKAATVEVGLKAKTVLKETTSVIDNFLSQPQKQKEKPAPK